MTTNTQLSRIEQWREFAKDNPDRTLMVGKVEQDLKNWADSEERLLRAMRARAVSKTEERPIIMIVDARIKELDEFRKAILG
jgi:hypothetical protein